MTRIILITILACLGLAAAAQPKTRRNQTQQTARTQQSQSLSQRARLMFPTALDMPDDVVWRRDIYREIDLTNEKNAGLYYPVEPQGRELNLFTYIFKLALNGYIPVYEYRLDGSEQLTDDAKVDMKTILDNYHIFYEDQKGKPHVDNSDIPSAEVKLYYLKESAYYSHANSTFHRKVLALCPVMLREDDFGGEAAKYPLFWVKYSDLEPYLSRQTLMTSNLNNAATMTADDYFTLCKYSGKIYKTNNMLGRTLAQYCPTDTAMAAEQKRIEAELEAFSKNIFGSAEQKKDSLDSIAKADPKRAKAIAKKQRASRRSSATASVKKSKAPRQSGSAGGGSARVTVRRERH